MSHCSSKKPSYSDLSALYESSLLNYRLSQERLNESSEEEVCRNLIHRAGLQATLQCAAAKADPANVDLARALLEQARIDMDMEVSMEGLNTRMPSIDESKKQLSLQQTEVDVDAFFEVYPECQREVTEEEESDDDDSDSSDEEIQVLGTQNNNSNNKKKMPVVDMTETYHQHTRQPAAPSSNPYAKQQQQQRVQPPPAPVVAPPQYQNPRPVPSFHTIDRPRSAGNNIPPQQQQTSWEDHSRNQNPFQTAREFALVAPDNTSSRPTQQHHHHHQEQQPPQHQPSFNPYMQQHQPYEEEQRPPPDKPFIRDSLKRKFQPPVKRANNGENTTRAPPRKLGLASGARAGGTRSRPPEQKQTRNDNKNAEEDGDDDLPEELKRFGKELVEKIEQEICFNGDPVTFQDIAGLADAKQTVQEVVCWPMKRPDLFTGLRRAPNGLLLYGPPGTGKTLIGKAIAHESGATFFSISSSSLTSKWIGEGEKLVRTLFAVAAYKEPAVVFIDEIDSLLTQRKADENEASRRIKTEFLVQLDGTGTSGQGRVLVIGATNRPQELDEAARRRFTKRLYIPLPEEEDRFILLNVLLETNKHALVVADVRKLAKDTAGFSGADLKALSTDAAMGPIRQLGARALDVDVTDVPPISYKHFRQALRGMKPSVAPADLVQYLEWDKTYGSKRAEDIMDDDSEEG